MRNSKRVFVLGAGFSSHLSRKIFPLGNELTNIIKELDLPELNKYTLQLHKNYRRAIQNLVQNGLLIG